MSDILTVTNLCYDSDEMSTLYNLNLTIQAGSINMLLGYNGDGKEKLLEIIAGHDQASSGDISFCDKPLKLTNTRKALQAGILYISNNSRLTPDLSIKESLTLGLSKKLSTSEYSSVLKETGLNNYSLSTLCSSLSISESFLLLLARALISNAKLFLFDKIDIAFSQQERSIYFSLINKLKSNGATILAIPAIVDDMTITDNIFIIKNGSFCQSIDNISDYHNIVFSDDNGSVFSTRESSRSNSVVLESLALKRNNLNDASINIRTNEVCGIYGLTGSGIDDLISILRGQTGLQSGVLSANGTNIQTKKINPVLRNKAGVSVFNGILNSTMNYDSRNMSLRSLKGNILLLIDPAYGLPANDRRNFYNLIHELKSDNKAIILFSSSLEEIKGLSNSIAIIHNGELSAARSNDNWTDEEIFKYVTSGKLEAFSIL